MPFDGTNYETDKTLSILRRGRERVAEAGGWIQGIGNFGASYCTLGAIDYLDAPPRSTHAKDLLIRSLPWWWSFRHRIRRKTWNLAGVLILYNDSRGRTQSEIVALFDRAIARREAELQTGGSENA